MWISCKDCTLATASGDSLEAIYTTPAWSMRMFLWFRLICDTCSTHFQPGAVHIKSRGPVAVVIWNAHWLKSSHAGLGFQRKQRSPASQPPTHRRQAGEIPARDHCLNVDALSTDRFVAGNNCWTLDTFLCPFSLSWLCVTSWKVILSMQTVHLENGFLWSSGKAGGRADSHRRCLLHLPWVGWNFWLPVARLLVYLIKRINTLSHWYFNPHMCFNSYNSFCPDAAVFIFFLCVFF